MNRKFGALSSSQNPEQLSLTVKMFVAALLPVIKNIWGFDIGSETTDSIIDAIFTLIVAGIGIYAYARSK